MFRPNGYEFSAPFWSENAIDLPHFCLKWDTVFEVTVAVYERICRFKREKYGVLEIFSWRSNLSNYVRSELEARFENVCGK